MNVMNLKIRFVDGREDLVIPRPINYENYWCMFQYLSKVLRTRCIHEDEIIDVSMTGLPVSTDALSKGAA